MLVIIRSFLTQSEASAMQSLLDAEGILSFLKDEHTVVTVPFLANAIGGVKLMVSDSDTERANELLVAAGYKAPVAEDQHFLSRNRGLLILALVLFVFFLYHFLKYSGFIGAHNLK